MKITPLSNLANLQNENTAVTAINANNARITSAINNTLSRDGSSPNEMEYNLDMNSFRVINVPDPSNNLDAANKEYVDGSLTRLVSAITSISHPTTVDQDNVLFPESFGAVGDGVTDDFAALQNWLTMVGLTGKQGWLTAGKSYYSNGSLVFTAPSAVNDKNLILQGWGSSIKTNPASFQTNLTVRRNISSRFDESRYIVIEGFTFDQLNNPKSVCGLDLNGATRAVVRNCNFVGGSDILSFVPYANQTGLRLSQRSPVDFNSGTQLASIEGCTFHSAAVRPPFGIIIEGQCNGSRIVDCNIGGNTGIAMGLANAGIVVGDDLANAITIAGNRFEDCGIAINVAAGASTGATCQGLQVFNNRIESVSTAFFQYSPDAESNHPPIVGPNYNVGIAGSYVIANFMVDIRDTLNGSQSINPASLNPGDTTTIGPISVPLAAVGAFVEVRTNTDLLGIVATGYVSSTGQVTIRLSNPTTGAVNLPGSVWLVTVRPAS